MILPPEVIVEQSRFNLLKEDCDTLIDQSKQLPNHVFGKTMGAYRTFEYAYLQTNQFAAFLEELAKLSRDSHVNYMTVDPDPKVLFEENKYFGAASLETSTITNRYKTIMSSEVRAEMKRSFLIFANVGVFWGSSLNWAIFCDRISWELAVIGLSHEKYLPPDPGITFLDRSALSEYMEAQYHWKPEKAEAFLKAFLSTYPI